MEVFAYDQYPISLTKSVQFTGGELLIDTNDHFRSYLVKPNWTNSLEVVSTWSGFSQLNKIGKSLGNLQIQKAFLFNHHLILITTQNQNLVFLELDSLLNQINILTIDKFEELTDQSSFEYYIQDESTFYLKINESLYYCKKYSDIYTFEKIANNVFSFSIVKNNPKINFILVEKFSDFNIMNFLSSNRSIVNKIRVSAGDNLEIKQFGNILVEKSSFSNSNSTLLEFIDLNRQNIIESKYFDCSFEQIDCMLNEDSEICGVYLFVSENSIILNSFKFDVKNSLNSFNSSVLQSSVFEPLSVQYSNGLYYAIFRNAILAFNDNLEIQLYEQTLVGKNFSKAPIVFSFGKYVVFSSLYFSERYTLQKNPFWFIILSVNLLAVYLIPAVLILIGYYFYRKYKKQKKLLDELISLPSSGLMIILNKNKEISRLNKQARDLLGIDMNIPLQKPINDYLTMDFVHDLKVFINEGLILNQNQSKRILIVKDNQSFEFVFSISPIWSLSGKLKGYLINGYDITEQLERKRLSNWAQLAHDMQTNLLTIKLNTEQLSEEQNSENAQRVGKILYQVNLLQKRVRDIVTVGRSAKLELTHSSSRDILNEVEKEFDKAVFPNINILTSGNDFDIFCDRLKLIRAIRNAVENSIKAIPEQSGNIELECWLEPKFSCFQIKDNGIGMDEKLKKKILTPFFTTSKDGSGFGLGTMIIQQVVELHHGKIQINSELGKGTEFIIKIPRNLI